MLFHCCAQTHEQLQCLRWLDANIDLAQIDTLCRAGTNGIAVILRNGQRCRITYTDGQIAVAEEEDPS